MIDYDNITAPQMKIIKKICSFQLKSLKRLYEDRAQCQEDLTLYLIRNEVSQENFMMSLEEQIEDFEKLKENPTDLRALSKDNLSSFKHWLTNIQDEWSEKYPKSIGNLWLRIRILENIQNNQHAILN